MITFFGCLRPRQNLLVELKENWTSEHYKGIPKDLGIQKEHLEIIFCNNQSLDRRGYRGRAYSVGRALNCALAHASATAHLSANPTIAPSLHSMYP